MISGDLSCPMNQQDELERKKREVQMLKSCLGMKRVKLSMAISDIRNYCFEHIESDQLVYASKDDPFKSKRKCEIF